jgi:hypothetical protein
MYNYVDARIKAIVGLRPHISAQVGQRRSFKTTKISLYLAVDMPEPIIPCAH